MSLGRMNLGRLPELMDRLAGMGSGITITPILEEGIAIGGFEKQDKVLHIAGWTITYETLRGSFTVSGTAIAEAVDAAFANRDAW